MVNERDAVVFYIRDHCGREAPTQCRSGLASVRPGLTQSWSYAEGHLSAEVRGTATLREQNRYGRTVRRRPASVPGTAPWDRAAPC